MNGTEPNKKDTNQAKLNIYNEAKKLFFEKGYYDTTVREIAKNAGVNYGLYNYYFQSKFNIATKIYDEMFYNIQALADKYMPDEKNPAVFMGVMMRMHTYALHSKKVNRFVIDALKEGIFTESIFNTTTGLVRSISDYYERNYPEEKLNLLLAITLGTEKAVLLQKNKCSSCYTLEYLADTVLRIHLYGFQLREEEIEECTRQVKIHFNRIQEEVPNLVDRII